MKFPSKNLLRSALFLLILSGFSLARSQEPLTVHARVSERSVAPGATAVIEYQVTNRSENEATSVSFSLDLPPGVVLANPPSSGSICGTGVVSGMTGGTSFSVTGGTVAAESSCSFSVNVVAASPGDYTITSAETTSSIGTACPAATTLFVSTAQALLGSALEATVSGTEVTFDLHLENLDADPILDPSVRLDLDLVFGAQNFRFVAPPVLVSNPGTLALNTGFNGSDDTELIAQRVGAGNGVDPLSLSPGATAHIRLVVDVVDVSDVGNGVGNYLAQASVFGRADGGVTTDLSDAGVAPNPGGGSGAGGAGNDDPTSFAISVEPELGAAMGVRILEGRFGVRRIKFVYVLENLGEADLIDVSVTHDISSVFGAGNFQPASGSGRSRRLYTVQNGGNLNLNALYNGSTETGLLEPGSRLSPGERAVLFYEVEIVNITDQGFGLGTYESQFTVSADSVTGGGVSDLSDAGILTDTNGNGVADDAGESDPLRFSLASDIGVSTDVTVLGNQVTLDYYLEVFGLFDVSNVTLNENLDRMFGAGNYQVNDMYFVDDPESFELNYGYDGGEDTSLIAAGGTLSSGDTAQIRVEVALSRITNLDGGFGKYVSGATATGTQPGGAAIMDTAVGGTDPDPNGDDNPGGVGENGGASFSVVFDALVGGALDATVAANLVTLNLYLENFGSQAASEVSAAFDLDAIFGEGNYAVNSAPMFVDDPGTLVINSGFDGATDSELFAPASILAAGDTAQIQMIVEVTTVSAPLDKGLGLYSAQFEVTVRDSTGFLGSDLSNEGVDPDPNGDGDPTLLGNGSLPSENEPTKIFVGNSNLGFALEGSVSGNLITYVYTLENLGEVEITDLTLASSLSSTFGFGNFNVVEPPMLIEGPESIGLNSLFDGSFNTSVLFGGTLAAGETARFSVVVNVSNVTDRGNGLGVYDCQFTVFGEDVSGVLFDESDAGLITDTNGNGLASDAGESDVTRVIIGEEARIGSALDVAVDGSEVTLDLVFENLGNVSLSNLSSELDLDSIFGVGNYTIASRSLFLDPGGIVLNGSHDGSNDTQLFSSGSNLVSGALVQVRVVVDVTSTVNMGFGYGNYQSRVHVTGTSPGGMPSSDLSDDGIDPDPNGNGYALEATENDPSAFSIETSAIGLALGASVDGTLVTFDYTVRNLGNSELSNVSLPHDLDAVFGAGNYTVVRKPFFTRAVRNLALNSQFDGSSDTELVSGGTIAGRVTETFRIVVQIDSVSDRGSGLGAYSSQISVSATGAFGSVTDFSTAGTEADPDMSGRADGPGEDEPTHFLIQGVIGNLVWNDLNRNGIFDAGEPGLEGVRVFIDLNGNQVFESGEPFDVTDASGQYSLQNLLPGTYSVVVDTSAIPEGLSIVAGENPRVVELASSEQFSDADFGFAVPASPATDSTATFQPDLRIGEKANPETHQGDDKYGGGQKLSLDTSRGRVRMFFSVQNDGNSPDTIRTASRGLTAKGIKVKIRERNGGGNVTASILRQGYVKDLDVGEVASFKMTLRKNIRKGKPSLRAVIQATSTSTGTTTDRNTLKIRFERARKSDKPTALF